MKLIDYVIQTGIDKNLAEKVIRSGKVKINNQVAFVPSILLSSNDQVTIAVSKPWVSRGSYKLLGAFENFDIDLNGKIVLDIGASTGGFTQVCLSQGAKKVYALDVGTNQLDYSLRQNQKVTVLEKTNLKTINPQMFDEKIEVVVCDVSFIALFEVFKILTTIKHPEMQLIALIKPQFEAKKHQVLKGGYVDQKDHHLIIEQVIKSAKKFGFDLKTMIESPLKGLKSKNIEYIGWFEVKNE